MDSLIQLEDMQKKSLDNMTFANEKQKEFYEKALSNRNDSVVEITKAIDFLRDYDMHMSKNPLVEYRHIMRNAIEKWGQQAQINMFHEEIGELMQAVNKLLRADNSKYVACRDNVIEEIADVEIMLEQIKIMVRGHAGVHSEMVVKLKRLEGRVDGATDKPAE